MTRPKGTLTRNSTLTRLNHWFTAACFVLLTISGLSMFHPLLFWMSEFFGGGQWTRAIHPWIGIALLISYTGLIVQFWRDNLWNRDDLAWSLAIGRVLANEEEGVPTVGRFNAGQKFVFWSMALLIPVLFRHRHRRLGSLLLVLHFDRNAAGRTADPFPGRYRRDHRLDHPCLRRDLGERLHAGHDARLGDAWMGVAAPSQVAARVGSHRLHGTAAAHRRQCGA